MGSVEPDSRPFGSLSPSTCAKDTPILLRIIRQAWLNDIWLLCGKYSAMSRMSSEHSLGKVIGAVSASSSGMEGKASEEVSMELNWVLSTLFDDGTG